MAYPTEIKVVGLSFRKITEKLERGDRVKLVPEPDNKYDPNALSVQTETGKFLGYVGKKDPLRIRLLERANKEEVTLPVLIANYYKNEDKLWESVEVGDMVQLWLRAFSKTPLDDNSFEEIESFTGDKVLWSEYLHICTDMQGNELMGGSTYASQFDKDFDKARIAKSYAKKNELDENEVLEYWERLGTVSANYGTAIHTALEHYSKTFKTFGHDEALPRQTHLREAVKAFLKVSDFENCVAEPLITDVEKGMSGWIDNLRFLDDKTVRIEDYKTNTYAEGDDVDKRKTYDYKWRKIDLVKYNRQLDFYGTILLNHGYKVESHIVWHWHMGKWDKHELKFKPVENYRRGTKEEISLPVNYSELEPNQKRLVREEYIRLQDGKCYWCKETLGKEAPKEITDKKIDWSKFPKGFLDYPVHLQHNHDTDKTEGAVHAYCNAVMWQYHGK